MNFAAKRVVNIGINPYKTRIEALIKVWSEITSSNRRDWTREELADLVFAEYSRRRIEPLRGKQRPPDIFEKELSSLYFVGKYGLGLIDEYPEIFNGPLALEAKIDELVTKLMKNEDLNLKQTLGPITKEDLIKILRVPFTGVILGFMEETAFSKFLEKIIKEYPEFEDTIRNYKRFYIAFKLAESIAKREVKNRVAKEALKHAIAVRINSQKNMPSDRYIYIIASEVFKVPSRVLQKILLLQQKKSSSQE